jgi:hypothetical protein
LALDSIQIISLYWPVILVVSIGLAIATSGVASPVKALVAIVFILILIIVYGRIVARMVPGRTTDSWGILKENGINYLIAGLIAGLHVAATLTYRTQSSSWSMAQAVSFVVVATFLIFVAFAAATRVLLESASRVSGSDD